MHLGITVRKLNEENSPLLGNITIYGAERLVCLRVYLKAVSILPFLLSQFDRQLVTHVDRVAVHTLL